VDSRRAVQLKAIFEKYRGLYPAELLPVTLPLPGKLQKATGQYRSELGDMLKIKFGIELIFHASSGKPPYGYSVIDHAEKNVFKGSEVMALRELLQAVPGPTKQFFSEISVGDLEADECFATGILAEDALSQTEAYEPAIRISIADDIDDEAVLGRNRRRKKKARTNMR
jgi:hypothetical protein